MPTKAKRVQLKDIKQGKTFWRVRCDIGIDNVPKIHKIDRLFITRGLYIYKVPSYAPRKPVKIWRFGIGTPGRVSVNFVNRTELSLAKPFTVRLTGNHHQYFSTNKAAERFADAFMRHTPTKSSIDRARYIEGMMASD